MVEAEGVVHLVEGGAETAQAPLGVVDFLTTSHPAHIAVAAGIVTVKNSVKYPVSILLFSRINVYG